MSGSVPNRMTQRSSDYVSSRLRPRKVDKNNDFASIPVVVSSRDRSRSSHRGAQAHSRDQNRRHERRNEQTARDRHNADNNVAPVVALDYDDPENDQYLDIPEFQTGNRGIDIIKPEDATGPMANKIRRRAASLIAEHDGESEIINVQEYDVEQGGRQSRYIEVKLTGYYLVKHGDVYYVTDSNYVERHIFHLQNFSSQESLLSGIQRAIARFMNMIRYNNKDSGYKVFYPIIIQVTGIMSEEEVKLKAHNPTLIRLHAKIPIQYGFLKRMGVNVTLAKKQENTGLNCFTAAVLNHIVKNDIMKRMKLTEEKIALEILDGRKLLKNETLGNRGYSIHDGETFFDKYEAFNVYIFDQLGNVLWKSEYNKGGKKRLATPFMAIAHNAHLYTITDDKIRTSLIHRVHASSKGVKTNLFGNDEKDTAKVLQQEKLAAILARKRYTDFEWNEKEPLDLEKLNKYKDCNIFMDKKCLHSTLIELFRQQNYIHTGEYSVHGFSRINYFNDVTIWCNPNTSPSLIKKDIALKGSSNTSIDVCSRYDVPFKNQSIGAATGNYADQYFNPLGAKSARRAVTPKQRAAHILRFKNICQSCKKDAGKKAEIDHIIRKEVGGNDNDSNLQLLCKGCHDYKTRQEVNIFKLDRTMSHFNTATVDIFSQAKNAFIHTYCPLEVFGHLEESERKGPNGIALPQFRTKTGIILAGLDMQKCRTNILRFGMGDNEFPAFTVLDDIIPFDVKNDIHIKIPTGEYYVHTQNICPAKGNGWLGHVEVRYMLAEKIIQLKQIKWIIRASLSHAGDYYSKMVESVLEKLITSPDGSVSWKREVHIAKSCINQFIGTWGTRTHDYKSISIYDSIEAAATDSHLRTQGQSSVQIATSEKKNNDILRAGQTASVIPRLFTHKKAEAKKPDSKKWDYDYIETIYKSKKIKQESHVPIFRTVLGQEAVHLHMTMRILEKFGGVVVNCNTDNAIAMFSDRKVKNTAGKMVLETAQQQVDKMWKFAEQICWDKDGHVKKYKRADTPSMNSLDRSEDASDKVFEYKVPSYRIEKDPGFTNQKECRMYAKKLVDRLLDLNVDGSLQVDALAGCGKTTLSNHVIDILKERNVSHLAIAPTHVSCRLLGDDGQTMQSALSVLKHGNYRALSGYQVIIIDEKSMIKELYWTALCMLKKQTNIRFLIIGCWDQLEPVADRSATFDYEHAAAIHELCGGRMLRLSICRRSDTALFNQYSNMKLLDVNQFGNKECSTAVCFTNSTVHMLNRKWMNQYKKKKHMLIKTSEKAKTFAKCQDIIVYNGLPLMACETQQSGDLYNSERWLVSKWDEDTVELQSDNDGEKERREMSVNTNDLACLFRPAYATTAHKNQGKSIREPYSIYNWSQMSDRCRYVAVSRGVRLCDVNIMRDDDGEFM